MRPLFRVSMSRPDNLVEEAMKLCNPGGPGDPSPREVGRG